MKVFLFVLLLSQTIYAVPSNLTPEALDCFDQVLNNDAILDKTKIYKSTAVEQTIIRLCTYSNAKGATKCFLDAKADVDVMPKLKEYINIITIESHIVNLCANSRLYSDQDDKDMDSIDCYKKVFDRTDLFPISRQASLNFEKDLINLCVTANAKGAITCIENAKANPDKIFPEGHKTQSAHTIEMWTIKLCRGSKIK